MTFQISMYNHPYVVSARRLYWGIFTLGMMETEMFIYSHLFIGVL